MRITKVGTWDIDLDCIIMVGPLMSVAYYVYFVGGFKMLFVENDNFEEKNPEIMREKLVELWKDEGSFPNFLMDRGYDGPC